MNRRRFHITRPDTIALSYAKALERHVDRAFARLLAKAKKKTSARLDSLPVSVIAGIASQMFGRVAELNKRDLVRLMALDVFTDDDSLSGLLSAFVKENVSLINKTTSDLADSVSNIVQEAIKQGRRYEDLAEDLRARLDISKRHARLIARDQVGKAYSDITQTRQEEIGITGYVWRTAQDPRVRDNHANREGKTFSWSNPPADGHPGKAILCRCFAEPILPND